MNFGTPTYLYALAAITIPIVIHLWSKNTKTRVPFGSLKFLKETETKTTKHLFPSELLLLAIRILLVASLSVLFSAPFIKQPAEVKTAYLVDPNITIETFEKLKEQLDLDVTYWLSPVKTPISSAVSLGNFDSWSTLKVFSDYDSIVVYSNMLLNQFQSELTPFSSKVNWIQIPKEAKNQEVRRMSKGDEFTTITTQATTESLLFDLESGTSGTDFTINVYFHSDPAYRKLSEQIKKAITAINHLSPASFNMIEWKQNTTIAPDDWLIWLSAEPIAPRKRLIQLDSVAYTINMKSENIYGLNPNLSLESMLQNNFPLLLETALMEPFNRELDELDIRTIPEEYLGEGNKTLTYSFTNQPITEWILGLFLVLLLVERLVSQIIIKK